MIPSRRNPVGGGSVAVTGTAGRGNRAAATHEAKAVAASAARAAPLAFTGHFAATSQQCASLLQRCRRRQFGSDDAAAAFLNPTQRLCHARRASASPPSVGPLTPRTAAALELELARRDAWGCRRRRDSSGCPSAANDESAQRVFGLRSALYSSVKPSAAPAAAAPPPPQSWQHHHRHRALRATAHTPLGDQDTHSQQQRRVGRAQEIMPPSATTAATPFRRLGTAVHPIEFFARRGTAAVVPCLDKEEEEGQQQQRRQRRRCLTALGDNASARQRAPSTTSVHEALQVDARAFCRKSHRPPQDNCLVVLR